MYYYADTEFNGFGGELISLGLVRQDGLALYLVFSIKEDFVPWVKANVVPLIHKSPIAHRHVRKEEVGGILERYFAGDEDPTIVVDWPDDVKYISELLITGPGKMIDIPAIGFEVKRVDAWPNDIEGAKQHHALWDAIALRDCLIGRRDFKPVTTEVLLGPDIKHTPPPEHFEAYDYRK